MATSALSTALPDYEVSQELGRGAMGVVYLGRHKALDRLVAIKELPPSFAADRAVRERFLTEARVVAALDHPHIVVIHDFVDRAGHLALVMEHLPNGTVWEQFLRQGLAAPRACGLALATLAGVHHAHERGIMHRDIKPENLIFTHDWQLKVTDFGIAQVLTGRETMATAEGAIVGTPAYMSPEQAEGRTCGPPADVYASGAMLYEMLTGSLPFPHGSTALEVATARLTNDPVPIESVGPAVPGPIAAVVMTALKREERSRFSTAEEFGVALGEAAAQTWGPNWMSEAGTAVRGSEAIEEAARTTGGGSVARRRVEPGPTPSQDRTTIINPDADASLSGPPAASAESPAAEHVTPEALASEALASEALAPDALASAAVPLPTAPVVAKPRRQDLAGANLLDLNPADMLNLAEIRTPRSPVVPALLAVVAVIAALLVVLTGLGSDPLPVPRDIDLTTTVNLAEVGNGRVRATFLGVPIGEATVSGGQLDPGYLRYSGAGVLEFTSDAAPDRSVPFRAVNSPYATAPFVVAALVTLGGLGSVQSNLRGLRGRRIRVAPYVGLIISGALAGAGGAVLGMLLLKTPTNVQAVIAAAAAAAIGSVAMGEAYRRWRRRRRLRRVTVASVRR